MQKSASNASDPDRREWTAKILDLRRSLNLGQTEFGQRLRVSAMAVSR